MKTIIVLLCIVLLAGFLRFYQISTNPPALDWDEASMGYNAYAIGKTGADEYGNKFPISIRSFDDYKPAMYTYLDVFPVLFFGLNEFAVRFPSAIFGTILVLVTFFFVREIIDDKKNYKNFISLTSAFFLAISPWSLQFSRAAFEANVGLTFFVTGMLFFLYALRKPYFFALCVFCFAASLYSYHSFRVIVPLVILGGVFIFYKKLAKIKWSFFPFLFCLLLLSLPIYKSFLSAGSGQARLSMVTLFTASNEFDNSTKLANFDRTHGDSIGALFHSPKLVLLQDSAKGYFDHFNFDFLFFHGDSGRQHHTLNMGMLYLWDLPFMLIGIFIFVKNRTKKTHFIFLAFLFAPLPSAITTGTPHAVRAIAMIPFFQIFTATGLSIVLGKVLELKTFALKILIAMVIGFFFLLNVLYYLHDYYMDTPVQYADAWQYGYKQAFEAIKPLEDRYQTILFTYKYDQPYIYYLFYRKIDPAWYQSHWDTGHSGKIERMTRDIGKYQFHNINYIMERKLSHTLIVATPEELPSYVKEFLKEIYFPNGKVAFRIISI